MGERVAVYEDTPECGYYETKLVRDGMYVPLKLVLKSTVDDGGELTCDEVVVARINGEYRPASDYWPWCAKHVITEPRYLEMIASTLDAETAGNPPDPYKPADLSKVKPPF